MTLSTAADAAHRLFRVLETGDVALAHSTASPAFWNREATSGPEACSRPGSAGLLASSAWMRFAFTDLAFPITGTAVDNDRVYVRLRMQGLHTGAFVRFDDGRPAQIIPPTGRKIDFEQVHMLTLQEGLVIGHEAVRDDITMLGQLGAFPPTASTGLAMLGWKISGRGARAAAAVSAAAEDAAAS